VAARERAPQPAGSGDPDGAMVDLLGRGTMDVLGRLVDASNATLLAGVSLDGVQARCVYKPVAGERPLWDFPTRTLARREVAAYLLSAATGWHVVPPTVLRDEGPFGPGSVQLWISGAAVDGGDPVEAEPGAGLVDVVAPGRTPPGWRHVLDAEGYDGAPVTLVHADDPSLRRMAVFDVVANNADRKGGHVLRDAAGSVFGVDHGLTFNLDDKLRTVLWGWAGERLTAEAREVLQRLVADLEGEGPLCRQLARLLSRPELERTAGRAAALLTAGRHPRPTFGRPSIPWPAF
jgi:uncharacterized repeat protein (TIGR03843 family)